MSNSNLYAFQLNVSKHVTLIPPYIAVCNKCPILILSQDSCEDRRLKTRRRKWLVFEERSVVVDLYFPTMQLPQATLFSRTKTLRNPQKGVKSNGTLPIPYPKSRRGLVRYNLSHLWLALESTSKVLNLTCKRTSALPNKGSPCGSSSLTLIIVRCLQRIETIDHSYIVRC